MKEASLKSLRTVWVQLYGILEKAKLKRSVVARGSGDGKEGTRTGNTRGFQGSQWILHDTVVADTWHFAFVQTGRPVQKRKWTLMSAVDFINIDSFIVTIVLLLHKRC